MSNDKTSPEPVADLDDLVPAPDAMTIDLSEEPHLDPRDELPPHGDPMREPRQDDAL